MYKNGQQFRSGDGIVTKGVENTIRNVGLLGREGMRETDKEIVRIMLQEPKGRRSGRQGLLLGSDLYPVFLRGQLLPPGKLCFCRRCGCRRAFPRSFCRILSKVRRVRRRSAVWRLHSFGVFFQFVR